MSKHYSRIAGNIYRNDETGEDFVGSLGVLLPECERLRAELEAAHIANRGLLTNDAALRVENEQLLIELEAFFQATVSVLGDDEHRGRITKQTLELCSNTVYAYVSAHPSTKKIDFH